MRQGLAYDDVLLVPKHGVLEKRIDADISSEIVAGQRMAIPIISANMPSVTGPAMAAMMWSRGAYGILHRFNTITANVRDYMEVNAEYNSLCGVSLGLKDGLERSEKLMDCGCNIFCLDVAHGDHKQVINFIHQFKAGWRKDKRKLIVGNVATFDGAYHLAHMGADAIKVGVGPGAACRTREVTGFGVPQLTAIMDVAKIKDLFPVRIIADGGIKNSGDIVKALAAGADTVMIGSLLAGCDEAPNPGEYYGNASAHVNGHRAPEGVKGIVEKKGPVEDVIKELAWGIRSGLSYGGATNLAELRQNCEFIQVTAAGQLESQTRIKTLHNDELTFYRDLPALNL